MSPSHKPLGPAIVALAFCVGCGSNQAPTAPSTFINTQNIVISGNASLTAIGETTQLKAFATFYDGTSRDVTSDVAWSSTDLSVLNGVKVFRIDQPHLSNLHGFQAPATDHRPDSTRRHV